MTSIPGSYRDMGIVRFHGPRVGVSPSSLFWLPRNYSRSYGRYGPLRAGDIEACMGSKELMFAGFRQERYWHHDLLSSGTLVLPLAPEGLVDIRPLVGEDESPRDCEPGFGVSLRYYHVLRRFLVPQTPVSQRLAQRSRMEKSKAKT